MVQSIAPRDALEMIARGEVDVVDVREPHEWSGGHLSSARLISLGKIRQDPTSALLGDRVVFVCAAGVRSETAARLALSAGLKCAYNLTGGMRAWLRQGLPLDPEAAYAPAAE